jgi:hypothetical protein
MLGDDEAEDDEEHDDGGLDTLFFVLGSCQADCIVFMFRRRFLLEEDTAPWVAYWKLFGL